MKNSLMALLVIISFFGSSNTQAEDGYRLWLRYDRIQDPTLLKAYQQSINSYQLDGVSPTHSAIKAELETALHQLLDKKISATNSVEDGTLLIALVSSPVLS